MAKKKVEVLTIDEKLQTALIPVDKQPYKIPQNWCWVKIMNIGEVVTGSTPNTKEKSYFGGNVPFIKPADINQGRYIIFSKDTLSEEGKNVSRPVPKGSTCICCIGTIGKCGYLMVDAVTNQQINTIIPYKIVNSLFVYYYCISDYFQHTIINNSYATTIFIIKKSKMASLPFPLPPLAEQERIVNKLDNYISKLDEAKEKLEKVVDTYNYRKNLILHRAFTGQLTKNWRKENKFELDDYIKKKAITEDSMLPDEYLYEIPENWRWVRLGEINIRVIDGDRGKNYPKKKKEFFSEGYCIFLNAKNVTKDGFKFDNLEYITKEKDELLRSGRLNRGDIVMTTRGTIGNMALYDDSIIYDKLRINSGMVIFRSEFDIEKKYIIYLWQSILIKNQINILTTGTAQPQLPIKDLKKIHFPLPPIEEQKQIVKILDSILSKEKQVKEIAEKEIERVEDFKKNLLTRAFGGVLGTNNPDEENSIELLKSVL